MKRQGPGVIPNEEKSSASRPRAVDGDALRKPDADFTDSAEDADSPSTGTVDTLASGRKDSGNGRPGRHRPEESLNQRPLDLS